MIKNTYNSLHVRSGIGATAEVRQFAPVDFSGLSLLYPALIVVRQGVKIIRIGGETFSITAGQAFMTDSYVNVDVSYELNQDGFDSAWIGFDHSVIDDFIRRHPPTGQAKSAMLISSWSGGMVEAFQHAVASLANVDAYPEDITRHRMEELLLWLNRKGLHFSGLRSRSLVNQIRKLIFDDPGLDWSSQSVCERLGLSEATMRRRLAQEGHSLRNILTDIRMSAAVCLLQSTSLPVSQIATAVGYESHSRFALRFKDRFGFPPTVIRGHHRTGTGGAAVELDDEYRFVAE